MKNRIGPIRKTIRRLQFSIAEPRYYRYARENIECQCPLCHCPYRGSLRYSFVRVLEESRLIYYDVPKCASSTIRYLLFNNDHRLSLRNPRDDIGEYFRFSFVRNPWDRMVSNWKMFTTRPSRIAQIRSMTDDDVSSFEDFVHFARRMKNHHWQPQVLFLPDELSFLGRLETFDQDFARLCESIGMEVPTLPEKRNATERAHYSDYYTPALVEIVAGMYRDDIERFGYSFRTREG